MKYFKVFIMNVKLSAIFATTMLFLSQSPHAVAQEGGLSNNVYRYPVSISSGNGNSFTILPSSPSALESSGWTAIEDYTSSVTTSEPSSYSAWSPSYETQKPPSRPQYYSGFVFKQPYILLIGLLYLRHAHCKALLGVSLKSDL